MTPHSFGILALALLLLGPAPAVAENGGCAQAKSMVADVQAMYERAGYHAIDNYNGNAQASFWGEKILR